MLSDIRPKKMTQPIEQKVDQKYESFFGIKNESVVKGKRENSSSHVNDHDINSFCLI